MEELLEAIAEQNRLFKEYKDAQELAKKEGKTESAEFKTKIEKMEKDFASYEEKIQSLELKANRAQSAGESETPEEKSRKQVEFEKKAFYKGLLKGIGALTPEEAKVMTLADDESIGYMAPAQLGNEIIKKVVEVSPLDQLATVINITAAEYQQDRLDSELEAYWTGETALPTASDLGTGKIKIPAHNLGALAIASKNALDDVSVLEQEIIASMYRQFAKKQGAGFVSGNGVAKPMGIVSDADLIAAAATSGVTNKIDFTDMINLQSSLLELYQSNAYWLMNRYTLGYLRSLTNSQGQHIWQPSVAAGVPATILDRPYMMMPDMDSKTATNTATGKYVVAYGDFRSGYKIVRRVGIAIQRLVELYAPKTALLGTMRVGGQVILPEAIKLLKVK